MKGKRHAKLYRWSIVTTSKFGRTVTESALKLCCEVQLQKKPTETEKKTEEAVEKSKGQGK